VICGDRVCGDALYVKGGRQEAALRTIIGWPGVIELQCAPEHVLRLRADGHSLFFLDFFAPLVSHYGSWRAESSEGVGRWYRRIITRSP
jgi:hypothetical protein